MTRSDAPVPAPSVPPSTKPFLTWKYRLLDEAGVVRQRGKLAPLAAAIPARQAAYLALSTSVSRPETGWTMQLVTDDAPVVTFVVRRVAAYHVDLVPA